MKRKSLLFLAMIAIVSFVHAQEQLLVNENFQGWTNASAAAATSTVTKQTSISNETLTYSLWGITVSNTGYQSSATTNFLCSAGYLKMAKNTEITSGTMSIELSPLNSITKMWFVECTSGNNRGFQVWKKGDGDAGWVSVHSAFCSPNAGDTTTLAINGTHVAIKFTNLSAANYAFLTDLKIWGNVSGVAIPPTISSITPSNLSTIPTTGDISVVFSENVTRGTGSITIGGVAIPEQDISINGATVTIHYSGLSTDNSYVLSIPAGAFVNGASTPTGETTTVTYKTPDTIVPTLSKMSVSNGATLPVNGFISLVMSEACKAGTATISMGSKTLTAAVSASNSNLIYINYSGLAYDTDYTVTIPGNAITDLTGNSYAGCSFTFHTEVDAKGSQLVSFTPDATSVPTTSAGTVTQTINGYTLTFDGVQSAGARAASPYTYAFKCNYVLLPTLPTVGELSFYVQSGGGTVPQEYYIQKLAADGTTWNTIETFIIGNNDKNTFKTATAQSSVPTTLRLMYNSANLWFYNIDVYAFTSNVASDDGLNPSVTSSTPAASAIDQTINGSIKLVFSENVQLGYGNITLDGKTLTPSVVGKTVTLPYANLKYATNYSLTVAAGAFKDMFNNDCGLYTLNFTTKAKPAVAAKNFDFVVAADGSGNGTTLQSAFDAVPLNNANTYTIFVKNGTYAEYASLADTKNFVSVIGQSRDGVIITGNRRSGVGGYTTSTCQTVEILADNLYMENLTIKNTSGVDAGQAVALKVYGDKCVFKNIKLDGYQDTHLTSNTGTDRQYYLNCDIRGSVDFIFGNGVCFFDNCLLYVQDRTTANVICAPSTTSGNTYGYVFNNCIVDGASSQDGIYSLGRPWQNAPKAVYLNTKMNILSAAAGWANMSTIPGLFAEYGTVNGSNIAVSLANRVTSYSYTDSNNATITGSSPTAVLTSSEAANYTIGNVLSGADSWNATLKTETTATPVNLVLNGTTLSWDAVDGAASYVITKNGNVFAFTTVPTTTITTGDYIVYAVSEYGALSAGSSIISVSTGFNETDNNQAKIRSTIITNTLEIAHPEMVSKVDIISLNGQLIKSLTTITSSIDMSDLSNGCYLVCLKNNSGSKTNTKVIKK